MNDGGVPRSATTAATRRRDAAVDDGGTPRSLAGRHAQRQRAPRQGGGERHTEWRKRRSRRLRRPRSLTAARRRAQLPPAPDHACLLFIYRCFQNIWPDFSKYMARQVLCSEQASRRVGSTRRCQRRQCRHHDGGHNTVSEGCRW